MGFRFIFIIGRNGNQDLLDPAVKEGGATAGGQALSGLWSDISRVLQEALRRFQKGGGT
jgi:hypothetical protein